MNRLLVPVGIVLVGVGALWALQGAGVLSGSVMTGERRWLLIGIAAILFGAFLVVHGTGRRRVR